MNHFWPTLPLNIPVSQGVPLWWVVLWWVFQIVVFSFILFAVTRWALRIDKLINNAPEQSKVKVDDSGRPLNG